MEMLVEFIRAALRLTTPLLLAALGGAFMQVGGVPNVAMEGMMLLAALIAYIASYASGSWVIGLLAAVAAAALLGAVYAWFVIRLKADIFAVGITFNVLVTGVCAYIIRQYYEQNSMLMLPDVPQFPDLTLPFLSGIPWADALFNNYSFLIPTAFLLVIVTYLVIYKTPFGFWLRAAGSNPLALTSSGKNLARTRFSAFIISAVFCGLAGAHLSLGYLGMFALSLVAGRGFVALAIVLFGNGNPAIIVVASLIFGMADAASLRIPQELMPPQFPLMLPYVVTILAITIMGRFTRLQASNE